MQGYKMQGYKREWNKNGPNDFPKDKDIFGIAIKGNSAQKGVRQVKSANL
jgi:hypothetical protein